MQNSVRKDQEKEDNKKTTEIEDSNSMTIEFLRARLLSERSVSKTARQRADKLAKRVMELEEELKIVSLQRKKAEKAAAEVLAILENHGISDFSDTFDSSSDQEVVFCESKGGNSTAKEEKTSVTSRRGKHAEEFSGSEHEHSLLRSGSLSWRRCRDSPNSLEKKYLSQASNRWNSFSSSDGSSSKHQGKSCRQIKRRETRSGDEEKDESVLLPDQENVVVSQMGDAHNCFNNRPELLGEVSKNEEEKVLDGLVPSSLEDQTEVSSGSIYVNGGRRDSDMEIALEQQAQLIGRYEAEENAQREWEEKFKENNSCTPDSCEPGNRSDITEERDEVRAEATDPVDRMVSHDHGRKSEEEDVCHIEGAVAKTIPNGFPPTTHVDVGTLQDQQCSSIHANESCASFPDFSFPGQGNIEVNAKGKKKQELSENISLHPPSSGFTGHQSAQTSSHESESFDKGESSGSKNDLQALTLHRTSNGLGGVLEALQNAKFSLERQLNRLPLSREGGLIVEPPTIKAGDTMEIPVGCAGLFRVPADSLFEATAPQPNFLESGSGLSVTRNYPAMGVGLATGNRLLASSYSKNASRALGLSFTSSYPELGVGLVAGDRHIGSPYLETASRTSGSGLSSTRNYPDMGVGLAAGDRHIGPYLETTSRTSGSGLSSTRNYPDMGVGHTAGDRQIGIPYLETASRISGLGLNSTRNYSDMGGGLAAGDRLIGNPYSETMSRTSGSALSSTRNYPDMGVGPAVDERFPSSPYMETASRISTGRSHLDPYMDKGLGLPTSSRYSYPTFPDSMPQRAVNDGFPRHLASKGSGIPAEDHFSFYDDHQTRLNMHR